MVGVVAQKEKAGICAAWVIWPAAIEGSASQGVISILMPSSTSSCATSAVWAASERVSLAISLIGNLPAMPPAALISSTAISKPFSEGWS